MNEERITGSKILVEALVQQGVSDVFFLAGAPMIAVAEHCLEEGIRLVDTRHEQAAVMAAHAYARTLQKPGVCFACSGPGVANLVTGLVNAHADGVPVVALGGSSTIVGSMGRGEFQELDQVEMMRSFTRWSTRVTEPARIPEVIDRAFGYAFGSAPGPVYVDLPAEVLYGQLERSKVIWRQSSLPQKRQRVPADPAAISAAIEMIATAERPVVLTGSGALWSGAGPALVEWLDLTGIPIFTTPQSRGLVPEDHPRTFLEARSTAFKQADLLIVIGTRLNYMNGFGGPPRFGNPKLIQIDIDPQEFAKSRDLDLGIIGDARTVLSQLMVAYRDRLNLSRHEAWTQALSQVSQSKRRPKDPPGTDGIPIHPARLCQEIGSFMDRDAILCVDGHEILNFARQIIPTFVAGHRHNSGTMGCMGVGVPYGIGAMVAKPGQQVIVLHGDGSFGMNGMEMDTAVRHELNIITVISNNAGWAAIGGGFTVGRDLGHTRYDLMAEALGCHGELVERPEDIRPALERAAASGKPAVVNVITDPMIRSVTAKFGQYQV